MSASVLVFTDQLQNSLTTRTNFTSLRGTFVACSEVPLIALQTLENDQFQHFVIQRHPTMHSELLTFLSDLYLDEST